MEIKIELKKCWVRDGDGIWLERWNIAGTNQCVNTVPHSVTPTLKDITTTNSLTWKEIVFEDPNVPQCEKLVGMLCGVSDHSLEAAKSNAAGLCSIVVIRKYNPSFSSPYKTDGACNWKYAYPVQAEKLKKLYEKARGAK